MHGLQAGIRTLALPALLLAAAGLAAQEAATSFTLTSPRAAFDRPPESRTDQAPRPEQGVTQFQLAGLFSDAGDCTGKGVLCHASGISRDGSGATPGGCNDWLHCLGGGDSALPSLRNRESCWCDDISYSIGGELRYRYMDERNRLRPMGELRRDTYDLWRITPFMELTLRDRITGHVQAIDASIFDNDIDFLPIDKNRADLLLYYTDLNLLDTGHGDLHYRYGRQFLQYGSQHLVSPLGWSNTWRNFEGHRLYLPGDAWSIDAFAVQPVNGAAVATQFRPVQHDIPDQSYWFSGVFATCHQAPYGLVDLYWLWNDESQPLPDVQDGRRHTIGARYAGSRPLGEANLWLWDAEGGFQFGEDNFINGGANQDVVAGFVSLLGGFTATQLPWSPTLKGLFWWGSGDDDPTDGTINTVTTLFPLGHAYWGLIDNFNGANLLDYSLQLSVQPAEKLTLETHWHWFDKAASNDHIYNIGGVPLGNTITPGRHLGNELDLLATYAVNPDLSVQAGYFWFWYGGAVDNNAAIAPRDDAQQFYLMATWGF